MDYSKLAYDAIIDLLRAENAAVWLEVEAKLAERSHPSVPGKSRGIDPHHLTNARVRLLREGSMEEVRKTTRGGGEVSVLALTDRRRRETAFQRAAARKRLLQTRYLSWAIRASKKVPNLIGEAGERVVHESLAEAASAGIGYQMLKKAGERDIRNLLGDTIPGGPIDNAARLIVTDEDGLPSVVHVLIEVKNIRSWIYPSAADLYQLLDKASQLQLRHPDQRFLPVFICRKAHYLTFKLAKELGFVVFYFPKQPILPHSEAPEDAITEVRDGLGYNLERTDSAHPFLVQQFQSTLPSLATTVPDRWAETAGIVASYAPDLRSTALSIPDRSRLARELQQEFLPPEEEDEEWWDEDYYDYYGP